MGHSKGILEREIHSNTGLPKKNRTFQINNLTRHLQELEEQQQRQPRASTRKEITKTTAELNDIEIKSTILRINESRSWLFEKIKSTSLYAGSSRKKERRAK